MTVEDLVWQDWDQSIDIQTIKRNHPELRYFKEGSHHLDHSVKEHPTKVYKWDLMNTPPIELRWVYCDDCVKILDKYILGYGLDNEKYLTVFKRTLI